MNPLADTNLTDALTGSISLVVPEMAMLALACLLFVFGMFVRSQKANTLLALFGLIGTAVITGLMYDAERDAFAVMVQNGAERLAPIWPGPLASFVRWLAIAVGILLVLASTKEAMAGIASEYYACLVVIVAGVSLVARANDLVSLYLALEMISIPTYVLLYLPAQGKAGQEAAAKYFLLSVLSSAVMLLGFSYLYGLAGTTNLSAMNAAIIAANAVAVSPLAALGIVLAIAGLCFRITAVPFHYYAPDVYQGAPTGVVAQLAVMPKIAGFIALARILGMTHAPMTELPFPTATQVPLMLWVIAAATMTLGNAMALLQDNLKRIIAYSGIAHAGYMLLGLLTVNAYAPTELRLTAASVNGLDAILFYLVAYAIMTIGTIAVIAYMSSEDRPIETVDDLAGAGQTNRFAAVLLTVSLLSMIGFPFVAGFWGKFLLFFGLYDAPTTSGMGTMYRVLAVVAAVNAAIGAVYYLRIIGVIYLRSPLRENAPAKGLGPLSAAILCTIATLAIGFFPQALTDLCKSVSTTPGKVATTVEPRR